MAARNERARFMAMTPEQFRVCLNAAGMTQAAFARFLADHGHPAADVARSVRRWAKNGPPGEVVVILSLMEELQAITPPSAA